MLSQFSSLRKVLPHWQILEKRFPEIVVVITNDMNSKLQLLIIHQKISKKLIVAFVIPFFAMISYPLSIYLIGKKKVGVKESQQKIWSVKKLVTCPKFSHFLPPNFLF